MKDSDDCAWVSEWLPEFLAGRTSEADSERVRAHLEGCAECRTRANAVSLLQQTPVPAPDPDRWDDFVEGVVDETGKRKTPKAVRWISAAAAVLVISGGALLYMERGGGSGEPAENSIEALARDVAELPEAEAAAWTAGFAPLSGVPPLAESGITVEELEQLVKEAGRT